MKRIVIDARIINSTTGRYVERLVEHLQAIDTENHYIILVPEKDKDYWQPKAPNFEVQIANFKNYSLGEQIGFAKLLYQLKADLIHFCMPQQPLFYFRRHVTTVHDLILLRTYNSDKNWLVFHLKQLVGRVVFFVIGRTSRHILVPTQYTKQDYQSFAKIPASKITVTYEASDIATTKKTAIDLPFKQFLLYVGQQSDYKNVRGLIQAHQVLRTQKPELGLVIVGALNEAARRNKAWVEQHNFQGVHFTGFVSNEELAWLYGHCTTYVFPSFMEGFGLPGLEAMAFGAPVASSNATCLPEVYGSAAHYFNPHSSHDMAQKIAEIIDQPELRQALIAAGKQQVQKYSWHKMAQETHQVYLRALTDK
ncbi:MAG TPA: glycosyltransferase family 1 protein [Verrucomicrobiae bacterium]|nr:glycosyltransferase family 1 protein [Verrucomicrobiae bacterium]